MKGQALVLICCIPLLSVVAFAHGDEQHVMGTVTKISSDSITIRTTTNTLVTVGVVEETKFYKGDSAAKIADLKVGNRVVIHAKKDADKLVAHRVRFGQMTTAPKDH